MNARDIINAMDLLDEDLVLDAGEEKQRKSVSIQRLLLVAAIVALLGMLALTAIAAADDAGWFRQMFIEKSGGDLTAGQQAYIQDNTVEVGAAQVQNGYSLTLQSAITDGKMAFFRFLLTGPEGVNLDADWYGDLHSIEFLNELEEPFQRGEGVGMYGEEWRIVPGEGDSGSVQLLLKTERSFAGNVGDLSGHTWTMYIYGLEAGYRHEQTGFAYKPLARGCWSFQFSFPKGCERELELISEPVTTECSLDVGYIPDMDSGTVQLLTEDTPVEITSFRLRALTAELTFRYSEKESVNGRFGDIYLCMKDGTRIMLKPNAASPNFLSYFFDAPVDLDQADCILFPDGTILPIA